MRTLYLVLCACISACASAVSATDDGSVQDSCMSDRDSGRCADGGSELDAGSPDPRVPHIIVTPSSLDFGAPLLGTEVTRTITIENRGALLRIFRIRVEEEFGSDFSATPVGEVGITLAAAESTTVVVALRPTYGVEDHGWLVIQSNDPETPVLRVRLTSRITGDPVVSVCVLRPEFIELFADCETPEEISFDRVSFGDTVTRFATIWNSGSGNRPLLLDSVTLADGGAPFTLEVRDGIGRLATYPLLLEGSNGERPTFFATVQVTFTARAGGSFADAVVVASNDMANPMYRIPIAANAICPAGCSGAACDACPVP